MPKWLRAFVSNVVLVGVLVLLMHDTADSAVRNKHSNTFAHGGYYAGEVDVSFGTNKTVDAQNFNKGQAIGVANFCGGVRTGGNEPASLNSMTSSPASAHEPTGPGGPNGRVSSLIFLSPGIHAKATKGNFCLYKDAAGGFWSVERKATGSRPDDPGVGLTACSGDDQFHPDKGCFPKSRKASFELPDWKIIKGTIVGMQGESLTCYIGLVNGRGNKTIALADRVFCNRTNLIGRKVQLTLKPGRIGATTCKGQPHCSPSNRVMLVKSVTLQKKPISKTKGFACKSSGVCDHHDSNTGYHNCLATLAQKQNAELDQLYSKVSASLKKRDQLVSRSQQKTWPKFRIAQINWQTFRDSACDIEFWLANESSTGDGYISNCLCNLSYHRNLDLKRMLTDYGE